MTSLRATYRLQLGPDLALPRARELVPYLVDLGVSHVYLSPVLQARKGSTHGYDVVDPTQVSTDLGGEPALEALAATGIGVILDVVPNHMAVDELNPFWSDEEQRARFFDIDPQTGCHRRFLDVDELAGVRVEDPEVFAATHATVLRLVRAGVVAGLRVDHVDGLADPAGYLGRLRDAGAGDVWVEKILAADETLRAWPVAGTTGYEFLADVQRLLVDPAAEPVLTELAGEERSFEQVAHEAKLEQLHATFAPELGRLTRLGSPAPLVDRSELTAALASLPVYRTYVDPAHGVVDPQDRWALADAPDRARAFLLLEAHAGGSDELVVRFQQTSAAVAAKGVEDTAFYRYVRLLALNEVGSDPGRFGGSIDEFHAANLARLARFPRGLLTAQTHDTKRSADVRARLRAITMQPARWRELVLQWHADTAPLRPGDAPDWPEELLLYQTLVGAWPISADRLRTHVVKALREAKRNTSWIEPDERWEREVCRFAERLRSDPRLLDGFDPFVASITEAGEWSSLLEVALRVTSPGVPDVYQGDELWNLSLVDPDNRRPVDWGERRRSLAALRDGAAVTRENAKLFALSTLLDLRRRRPHAFAGGYAPIPAGPSTCAYRRGDDVVVVVPTRPPTGDPGDARVELPPGRWRNVLADLAGVYGDDRLAVYERIGV
jgi:(1->4)-alpha-D-glucan 1-alpha-D-glucosylmutase